MRARLTGKRSEKLAVKTNDRLSFKPEEDF